MPDMLPRPAPKIPRGEVRRQEVLLVAARVLLRDGLDGASMDLIATEAGASKATLYRHFGDRHGLVVAVVEFLCGDFIADVDRDPPPGSGLEAGLSMILMQLVHVLAKPDHPAFFRLIVAGTQRDPAIGRTWYEHGPRVWHAKLGRVFEAQRARGVIAPDTDCADYPGMLFDAVFTDMIVRTAVLGEASPRAPEHYVARLVETVARTALSGSARA